MEDDGLIYAGVHGIAVTWMDAIVYGKPVTQRTGKTVEINSLWYNAICFALSLAARHGDIEFISRWEEIAAKILEIS